ncbi:unnamed protein product, partial [Medioppia subpectinata]
MDEEVYYHMNEPNITSSRIANGTDAVMTDKPSEAPWAVRVKLRELFINDNDRCSGVLIAMNWVLTSAHCLEDHWYATLVIKTSSLKGVQTRHVNQTFKTPSGADLAMLQTDRHFTRFRDRVLKRHYSINTVCLPEMNRTFTSGNVTVFGFGYISDKGWRSDKLQKAILKLWAFDLVSVVFCEITDYNRLCASSIKGRTCRGDSGGGWVQYNDRYGTQAVVIGIHKGSDVYTRCSNRTSIAINLSHWSVPWVIRASPYRSAGFQTRYTKTFIAFNESDVGLIQTDRPFTRLRDRTLKRHYSINTVCLPEMNGNFSSGNVTVFGFGYTGDDGSKSENLQKAILELWSYDVMSDHRWYGKYMLRASPYRSAGFQTRHINQTFNSSSGADLALIQTDRPFDRLRDRTLKRHYSINTGDSGSGWIRYNDWYGTQAIVLGIHSQSEIF